MSFSPTGTEEGGLLGGAAASLFYNPQSYTDAAAPYMNNATNDINNYYGKSVATMQPYNKAGLGALTNYQGQISQMSDPMSFYNHIMNNFQMTPAQQQQQRLGLEGVSNNAAMNGMSGSGNESKDLESYAANNTAEAQQRYLDNIMGINTSAMTGNQNVMNQGFNAASNIGNYGMQTSENLASIQEAQAKLAAAQAEANNKSMDNLFGAAASAAGSMALG